MYPEPLFQLCHTRGRALLLLLSALSSFFVHWNRIHLLGGAPENLREVVSLIDRFLDGPPRYRIEWDDFIAWENNNAAVEQIRKRIKAFAHLLSSNRSKDRELFADQLAGERNRLAVLLGLPAR